MQEGAHGNGQTEAWPRGQRWSVRHAGAGCAGSPRSAAVPLKTAGQSPQRCRRTAPPVRWGRRGSMPCQRPSAYMCSAIQLMYNLLHLCTAPLGWVKCREHISLLIILCIIVYVTNKAHLKLICNCIIVFQRGGRFMIVYIFKSNTLQQLNLNTHKQICS